MDAQTDWVPLAARMGEASANEFFRLHDGVPKHMAGSLWDWLRRRVCTYERSNAYVGYWIPRATSIRELERVCRIHIGWEGPDHLSRLNLGLELLRKALMADHTAFLTAVDLHLSRASKQPQVVQELEKILAEAASAWRVGIFADRPSLVKRVDETVQNAAEAIAAQGSRSGKLLADAWRHAYSTHRDPSAAYRCAVRAVEAAAAPILTPSDPVPTLGKMIAAFGAKPEKWVFSFSVGSKVDPPKVLHEMLQLLWTNEYSRHIDPDISVPLHVSQEEAESAVALALTLVTWFTSGTVRPAP